MTIKRVRVIISQPRLHSVTEWSQTVEELQAFEDEVRAGAADCAVATQAKGALGISDWAETWLRPSEDACRWCKAKATCPKLQAEVLKMLDEVDPKDDLVSNEQLGEAMAKVPMVEIWCKAIRARVESELLAGNPVPGFKVVQGRKGPRQWDDADEVEQMFKGFKLKIDDMYDLKLISPTKAEELAEGKVIGPRQWKKVLEHIKQSDGKPSVAPESDKRPALPLTPVVDEFEDETAPAAASAPKEESVEDLL